MPPPLWVTKNFWLPFDGEGMSNGNYNFSIAKKKGGICNIIFEKKIIPPP
jgi:hypothetical protein